MKKAMVMDEIDEQIKTNYKLCKKIEEIMSPIKISDNNQRAMLFAAFLQDVLSHFCAMNILIEKGVYNSAFALVRVFFDTIVRGQYMAYILNDTDINNIYAQSEEWKFPKTKKMCECLDTYFHVDMFDKIREKNYGMMCDYTHTGYNQMARHFNEEKCTIEPNFKTDLVIDTLKGNYILLEFFSENFMAFIEKKNG